MENVLHKVDCYMELVLAKDSDLWEDMVANGYDDIGDYYTLATDEDGMDSVYADSIDIDFVARTKVVSMIGSRDGDCRCYDKEWLVLVDKQGKVWMDAEDFEEVFC